MRSKSESGGLPSRTVAIILAGGAGKRLLPLTAVRPKPLLPFGDVHRIIDFTLSNCLHSRIPQVRILTQYKHLQLHRYLRSGWTERWSRESGKRGNLCCLPPAIGDTYRGTADAVRRNLNVILRENPEFVLILAGDHIYQMDYRPFIRWHADRNADVTVAAIEYPRDRAQHFGIIETDPSGRMTGFEEKPRAPKAIPGSPLLSLASMGVYVFRPSILIEHILETGNGRTVEDFGRDLLPTLHFERSVYAYRFGKGQQQYWKDVGTLDAFHETSMDLFGPQRRIDPDNPNWPVLNSAGTGPAGVRSGYDEVGRNVFGPNVFVGEGALIRESVLMKGCRIGRGANVRRAIIEENTEIPDFATIGFDREQDSRRFVVTGMGVVVVPRRAVSSSTGESTYNEVHHVYKQEEGIRSGTCKKGYVYMHGA